MKLTNSLLQKESLMNELGLTDFASDQQGELFALMMDILEIKVLDAVLSKLTEAEQKEFTLILLSEDIDNTKNYLSKKIKNMDKLLSEVIIDFKQDLLTDILEAKKELLRK